MPPEHRFRDVRVTEVAAKSLLNPVRGMPFRWSINPYQGCMHGCVFCYARSTHAYRELDGVREWRTEIVAKVNAATVLREDLRRRWDGTEIALGTATDPYQAIEGRYRITRRILRELIFASAPAHLITRSPLVIRDVDLFAELSARAETSVCISLPTLDAALAHEIEPTVAPPAKRLLALERLAARGIRTGLAVAPILPGITDDSRALRDVVRAGRDAGASFIWGTVLHLGPVTRDAFFTYLDDRHPELVGRYQAMYRSKYAQGSAARATLEHYTKARSGFALRPPALIEPAARREQLSLL